MKNSLTSILLLTGTLLFTTETFTASFDCKKASTKHEKLICEAPQLDAADTQMGEAYKNAVKTFPVKGFIQAEQRAWGYSYRNCKSVEQCVAIAQERTTQLNQYLKSSVYSDSTGSKFHPQDALLIFYEHESKQFVRLFGNWMHDGYMDPDKIKGYPNDGYICNEDSELLKKGNEFIMKDNPEVSFVIHGGKVTMKGHFGCNARTGFGPGVYNKK